MTPALSFFLSFLGCAIGLSCTARSRLYTGRSRQVWLWTGALAIGGIGVWVMHFVAMLGFAVADSQTRYDIPLTAASMVLAVAAAGVGLLVVDRGSARPRPILIGGTTTGLGVAGMHYLGMRAMHTATPISYDPWLVLLSVVIAVGAATAGLWLASTVRTALGGVLAAIVMSIAVSGMHYTGMAAMDTDEHLPRTVPSAPAGLTTEEPVVPLVIVLGLSTLSLVVVSLAARAPHEIRADREFDRWRESLQRSGDGTPTVTPDLDDATAVGDAGTTAPAQRTRRATGR